jgi:hypothetical protein
LISQDQSSDGKHTQIQHCDASNLGVLGIIARDQDRHQNATRRDNANLMTVSTLLGPLTFFE